MAKYEVTNRDVYQGATMTNTETGHSVKFGDTVTVGKSKNEWFVNNVMHHGMVELERQASSPKRGLIHRRETIDFLTVVHTTRKVEEPAVATADEWPTVADLVECMQNEFRTEQGEDYTPSVDAVAESADELFPEVPDDDADAAAFHKRAEGIMNAALAIMRVWAAEQTPETPTALLHPKREVFDVKACKGNEVLEVVTINGSLKRARSVAEMLGCKYGFGPMHIDFKTSTLEWHQGIGNVGVEIEDLDADDPYQWGPWTRDIDAEMELRD